MQILAGIRRPESGTIAFDGHDITNETRRTAAKLGLAIIPEDRHTEGLFSPMTLTENVTINRIRHSDFSTARIWLWLAKMRDFATRMIERFQIRVPSERVPVRLLSGGNQQRVILARELSMSPRGLVAAEPTRGLDVAATVYVLGQLGEVRDNGTAVLFISSDLDQILSIADRVLVFFRGRVVASVDTKLTTREQLGRYMSGLDFTGAEKAGSPEGWGPHPSQDVGPNGIGQAGLANGT